MAEVDPKILKDAADAAKLAAKQIQAVTMSLSEQMGVVTALSEAYAQYSSSGVTEQVNSMTKALGDAVPVIDQISRKTRSTNKHLKDWVDNVGNADVTVTTLTGRMKELTDAMKGVSAETTGGSIFSDKGMKDLNDSHKKMDDTFSSMHDTLKEMQKGMEGFGRDTLDAAKAAADMPTKTFDDMSRSILGSNEGLRMAQREAARTTTSLSTLESGLLGAAATGGTFGGALLGIAAQSNIGQRALGFLTNMMKKPFTIAIGAAVGAVQGFTSGLGGILSVGRAVGGFFTNMIGWAFKLGSAILAIPVQFLGGLVEMAASMNMGSAEYLRQIEEVRDKFGNFRVGQSQAIKEMQKSFAKTTETGLNAFRIYGDLAERLKMITELVEGLGATWGVFQAEFARDGFLQAKRIDEFRMGLGLSHEQLRSTLMLSKSLGKSAGASLTELTKHVKGYAKMLNVSHKVLTRDVTDALKDAGRFGGATVSAIVRASAYARSLGHELKEIAGVLDAFETFDTAAEGAAKLAQSFGATVDAFKLVSAQSPDEMIQHLRDSMFAAGQSTESMNRQQLKLLASQSGLSEEVARSVFSMKNQGKSVEELKKQQEQQENSQVTQAKALRSLADDIKRLVKEMGPMKKSFVSMFIDGMKTGAMRSKEFMGLMWKIRRGLRLTWLEGFKLGRVVIQQVPALKKLFDGLNAFFNPSKFQNLAAKMRHILLDFFKGSGGVSDTLKRAQEAFTDFFNIQNPAARQMLEGAKMILKRVAAIIAEGITWVSKQLTWGIKYIADIISGKNTKDLALAGGIGGQALGFLGEILKPILDSLSKAIPMILSAFVALLVEVGKRLIKEIQNDPIKSYLMTAGKWMVTAIIVYMASRVALGMMIGALTSLVTKGISGMMARNGKSIMGAAQNATQQASRAQTPRGTASLGKQTGTFIEGWVNAAIAAGRVTLPGIAKLFAVLAAIGAGLAVGGVAFATGLMLSMIILKPVIQNTNDVIMMISLMGGIILGMRAATQAAQTVKPATLAWTALVLVAIGAALGAGGVALAYGIKKMHDELTGMSLMDFIPVIGTLGLLMGATAITAKIGSSVNIKGIVVVGGLMFALGIALAYGGAQLGRGIADFTKSLKGMTWAALGKSLLALGSVLTLTSGLALAAALIGKIGDPKGIAIGAIIIGVMGLFLAGMVALIGLVVSGMKMIGVSAQQILSTTKALQALATTMLIMIPVVVAAAALGSVMAGPQGLVIAAVLGIGLATITAGVAALSGTAMIIVKTLNDLQDAPGLQRKTKIFLDIMTAINEMVSIISKILKDLSPGLTDFIHVIQGGRIDDRIKATSKFIEKLIPGVQGIVSQVTAVITRLATGPDNLQKGAKIFADILGAMGVFIKALVPPREVLGGSTTETTFFSKKISETAISSSVFMDKVSGQIRSFMTKISDFVKMIANLPISEEMVKNGVPAITGVLRAMGTLMQALVPDSQTIAQFREVRKASHSTAGAGIISETYTNELQSLNTKGLKDFLTHVQSSFKGLIGFMTSASFTRFLGEAAKVAKNERQIKSLQAVGSIMSAIANVINSLSQSGQKMPKIEGGSGFGAMIVNMPPPRDINAVFEKLAGEQGGLKKMFDLLKSLSSGLGSVKTVKDLDALRKVFDSIGQVTGFMTTINRLANSQQQNGGQQTTAPNVNVLMKPVELMDKFLTALSKGGGSGTLKSLITKMSAVVISPTDVRKLEGFTRVADIIKKSEELVNTLRRVNTSNIDPDTLVGPGSAAEKAMKVITGLGTLTMTQFDASNLRTLRRATGLGKAVAADITNIKTQVVQNGLLPALAVVEQMVTTVTEMGLALNKIQLGVVPVTTGLRKVAGAMGVGGRANYTIKNNPINIHLSIQVEMKASEVEKAIVFRKSSVIRDQLRGIRKSGEDTPDRGIWGASHLSDLNGNGASYPASGIGGDYTSD